MLLPSAEALEDLCLGPKHQAFHIHLQILCKEKPVRGSPGHGPRPSLAPFGAYTAPWSESNRSEDRPEESRLSALSRSHSLAPGSPWSCSNCCCRLCCLLRSFSLSRWACCSCSSSFCRTHRGGAWGQLRGAFVYRHITPPKVAS